MSGVQHGTLRFLPRADPVNGGGSSPWTITADVIHPVDLTDAVAIGASTTVGSEILRVVGSSRFEGDVFIDPSLRIEDPGGSAAFVEMTDGSSAPVSALGEGRLRYNEVTNQWQISEDGGAYFDIAAGGSPWTDTGTLLHPTTTTRAVVVGALALGGTEIFRVTAGAILSDGTTGAVPVAGAGTRFMWSPASAAIRAGVVTGTEWDVGSTGANSAAFGSDVIASGAASIALGDSGIASGAQSFVANLGNTASAANATAFGLDTEAIAAQAFAMGDEAQASRIGQMSLANGSFLVAGDAQSDFLHVRRQTLDATPIDLTLDGAAPAGAALSTSNRIILEDDKTYLFTVEVLARNTAAINEARSWVVNGMFKRDVGVATTATVGLTSKMNIARNAPATNSWDIDFIADTVNGAARLEVSGQAGKTINWSATVRITEVGV